MGQSVKTQPLYFSHNLVMTTQPLTSESSPEVVYDKHLIPSASVNYVEEIETVIVGMAVDRNVMVSKGTQGHLWKFNYGTVEVFVQLTGETSEDTFSVWASVLPLPEQNQLPLMQKLLEMNWLSTFEAHFAISEAQVVVVSTRTVAELSAGEIARLITIVATLADENDEPLIAQFGSSA